MQLNHDDLVFTYGMCGGDIEHITWAQRYVISLRVLKYFFNSRKDISYLQAAK